MAGLILAAVGVIVHFGGSHYVRAALPPVVTGAVVMLIGFCPKFGALVAATPGGVLGGITLVLYGMIGLLGAKIWIENRVNFADPANLVPLAAGIIAGIGNLTIRFTSTFSITGIAAGTLIVIIGYHGVRPFVRRPLDEPQAGGRAYEGGTMIVTGNVETPEGEVLTYRAGDGPAHPARGGGDPAASGDGGHPAGAGGPAASGDGGHPAAGGGDPFRAGDEDGGDSAR